MPASQFNLLHESEAWGVHADVIQIFTRPWFCTTRTPLERLLICVSKKYKKWRQKSMFTSQRNSV